MTAYKYHILKYVPASEKSRTTCYFDVLHYIRQLHLNACQKELNAIAHYIYNMLPEKEKIAICSCNNSNNGKPIKSVMQMHIDCEKGIFFPKISYGICLPPIRLAVYILFIKHPQGILIKELPAYRNELLYIYNEISNRADRFKNNATVNNATDPLQNCIHEHLCRINKHFISCMTPDVAYAYCITGEKYSPRKIIIDRKLVIQRKHIGT
jgi:hypothetical protein